MFPEFQKQVLLKLNKILYKMDRFENMQHILMENTRFKDNEVNEEFNIELPLLSLEDLNNFEQQLQESQFRNKVVCHYIIPFIKLFYYIIC